MVRLLDVLLRETQQSLARRGVVRTLARLAIAPWYLLRDHRYMQDFVSGERQREFDRRFGLNTEGRFRLSTLDISSPNRIYGVWYQAIAEDVFHEALSTLTINYADFTFIDFGSGKGRALVLASEFPFKGILGLEFARELHTMAEQNIRNYRSLKQKCMDIRSTCADFTTFPIPDEKLVLFLYNPCQGPAMAKLVENIEHSLVAHPRELYILYCNPESRSLFDRSECLQGIRSNKQYCVYRSITEPKPECHSFSAKGILHED